MMPSILLKGKEEIILLQNVPFIRNSSVVNPQFLSDFLMEYIRLFIKLEDMDQLGNDKYMYMCM